jgi:hypothetical protein
LVDNLGEGAPTVRSGRNVAFMQAGARAQLVLEVVGECLGMRTVASITGGNGGVLVAETTTSRRANTASASCHESHSVSQLVAGPTPGGILLFGIQGGHDGLLKLSGWAFEYQFGGSGGEGHEGRQNAQDCGGDVHSDPFNGAVQVWGLSRRRTGVTRSGRRRR